MKALLAIAISLFLFSAPARAHFFIEPDFGFEFGTANQDFKASDGTETKSTDKQNGLTYGGGFGYRYNRIYAAAEYEKGMGGHVTDISGLVGFNLEIRLRIWLGYIFSAKDDVSSGSGFKGGFSLPLSRIFRLNAEYDTRTYNKYTGVQTSIQTYSETRSSFRFTVSFPWQIN